MTRIDPTMVITLLWIAINLGALGFITYVSSRAISVWRDMRTVGYPNARERMVVWRNMVLSLCLNAKVLLNLSAALFVLSFEAGTLERTYGARLSLLLAAVFLVIAVFTLYRSVRFFKNSEKRKRKEKTNDTY